MFLTIGKLLLYALLLPLLFFYLISKLVDFFSRIKERKKEDIQILNYVVEKHLAGEVEWKYEALVAARVHPHQLFYAELGKESLKFWIWKDGSCWLLIGIGELKLTSKVYPELKIIMKDLKKEFDELSPHKEILVNLGIDKAMQRQEKIESITHTKIKKFIKLLGLETKYKKLI